MLLAADPHPRPVLPGNGATEGLYLLASWALWIASIVAIIAVILLGVWIALTMRKDGGEISRRALYTLMGCAGVGAATQIALTLTGG